MSVFPSCGVCLRGKLAAPASQTQTQAVCFLIRWVASDLIIYRRLIIHEEAVGTCQRFLEAGACGSAKFSLLDFQTLFVQSELFFFLFFSI